MVFLQFSSASSFVPLCLLSLSVFHHWVLLTELSVITATLLLHHTPSAVLLPVIEISLLAFCLCVIYRFSIRKLVFYNVQHRGHYPTQVTLVYLWKSVNPLKLYKNFEWNACMYFLGGRAGSAFIRFSESVSHKVKRYCLLELIGALLPRKQGNVFQDNDTAFVVIHLYLQSFSLIFH